MIEQRSRTPLRAIPLAALLALAACGNDLASPFSAVVIAYDVPAQKYKLAQVRVGTLSSLRTLQGTSGTVTSGGAVRTQATALFDPSATVATLRAKLITAPAAPVDLSFNLVNDLVYPENFASLELLTAYVNVERTRTAFVGWGLAALQAAPLIAHADVRDEAGLYPLGDGELYYPPLGSFFLPALSTKAQLPLHFNLGAVAHAVGHQAVQQLIWGGKPLSPAETGAQRDPENITARHIARSMAEGLGDFLGVAVSLDPRWFDHSVQQVAAARALDQVRCGSADMLRAIDEDDRDIAYDPYPLGTVLAGALWESAQAGVQLSAKGVLGSLHGIGAAAADNAGRLSLATVLEQLAASAPDERRAALCGLFLNRFQALSVTHLAACEAPLVPVPPDAPCTQ